MKKLSSLQELSKWMEKKKFKGMNKTYLITVDTLAKDQSNQL